MIATVIRLPEEEHAFYKEFAFKNGFSLASFFRSAAKLFVKPKVKKGKFSIFDLGTKITVKGGPRDGSINHDKYLYHS